MNDGWKKTPVLLVVDDEPSNLQLLGSLLSNEFGCDICFATSGRETLEFFESVQPDLVLLDVNMPGMDGYEVCRAIRATEGCREIPVIFLTAQGEKADIIRGFEAGGADYVVKPFEMQELLARVRTHLELKLSRDELKRQKDELEAAINRIRRLEGVLPICCHCKKIRNEENLWEQLEVYIADHSEALFSHGICPDCKEKHYSYLKR
jgi:DNA-binding response OmpR family regulator